MAKIVLVYNLNFDQFHAANIVQDSRLNTVKPVTQPTGYVAFSGVESRVVKEGGLSLRAGKNLKCNVVFKKFIKIDDVDALALDVFFQNCRHFAKYLHLISKGVFKQVVK